MSSLRVDLNADIGESSGMDQVDQDERLLRVITSGSIACGVHAGDPSLMRRTVRLAAKAGVAIGAHPGFPDPAGFGRRELNLEPNVIADLVLSQIDALAAIARAEGLRLQHVKPHGALYHMSCRRGDIADAVAGAVASFDDTLMLFGLPGSELLSAGTRRGLRVAAEGFPDRSYEPDRSLTPRDVAGAVVSEPGPAADRAVRMIRDKTVTARDGSSLALQVDTLCVHGDTNDAAEIAAAVRLGLEHAGIRVAAFDQQNLRFP